MSQAKESPKPPTAEKLQAANEAHRAALETAQKALDAIQSALDQRGRMALELEEAKATDAADAADAMISGRKPQRNTSKLAKLQDELNDQDDLLIALRRRHAELAGEEINWRIDMQAATIAHEAELAQQHAEKAAELETKAAAARDAEAQAASRAALTKTKREAAVATASRRIRCLIGSLTELQAAAADPAICIDRQALAQQIGEWGEGFWTDGINPGHTLKPNRILVRPTRCAVYFDQADGRIVLAETVCSERPDGAYTPAVFRANPSYRPADRIAMLESQLDRRERAAEAVAV